MNAWHFAGIAMIGYYFVLTQFLRPAYPITVSRLQNQMPGTCIALFFAALTLLGFIHAIKTAKPGFISITFGVVINGLAFLVSCGIALFYSHALFPVPN